MKLYASLRKGGEQWTGGKKCIEVPDGTTVESLMVQLGIDSGEVSLVFVNALRAETNRELRDGDQVDIFPPVAGGTGKTETRRETIVSTGTRRRVELWLLT